MATCRVTLVGVVGRDGQPTKVDVPERQIGRLQVFLRKANTGFTSGEQVKTFLSLSPSEVPRFANRTLGVPEKLCAELTV